MAFTNINTIDDVIKSLDIIIAQAIKDNDAIGYFASLYRKMTIAVKQGILNGSFQDAHRMEALDVCFAKRYLDAYSLYKAGKMPTKAWKVAFDTAKANKVITMQHLFLGINAHINLDLGIAAAITCPKEKITSLKHDFDSINTVIASLTRQVQDELTEIWFPMSFIDKVTGDADDQVLNFSIGIAREAAWKVANDLAFIDPKLQAGYIQNLDNSIASLGLKIANPPFLQGMVLKIIKLAELSDPKKIIQILNT